MVKYIGEKDYEHGSKEKIGVLITNLGTPDAPNKKELKVYDICNNAASGNVCTYNNNKNYSGTRLYDQMVIGRMEVNISTGRVDNQGNKKPKKGYLYLYQIRHDFVLNLTL